MSTGKRYTSFSKTSGHVDRYIGGVHSEVWTCSVHGEVQVIPYYLRHKDKKLPLILLWSCPFCVLEHHNIKEVKNAKEPFAGSIEKDTVFCEAAGCIEKNNLNKCEICGAMCCSTHRVVKECRGCYDRATEAVFTGYS